MIDFRNFVLKLNCDGVSFIISSHLLHELEKIATDFIFLNHGEIISKMTSDEFLNANSCYIQLEVYDMDIFKNVMDDLKINYLPDDNSKNNVFFNFTLSDLVVRLNDYGCTVRKCFNVENDLKEFS